jgi:hypothetical protein
MAGQKESAKRYIIKTADHMIELEVLERIK